MNTLDYIQILENPENIQQTNTAELKSVVENYPYFQSARALYLKGLKNQDSFKYNNELKITAAYTKDRSILFDFITDKNFEINLNKTTVSEKEDDSQIDELSTEKPLSFTSNDTYSFNEWLQLSSFKPIVREKKVEKPTEEKTRLIDKFIKSNPKITPVDKNATIEVKTTDNSDSTSLMTETLAKVYLAQKKYDNAIKAYQILSLKYPEKSGFFADQIKSSTTFYKNINHDVIQLY